MASVVADEENSQCYVIDVAFALKLFATEPGLKKRCVTWQLSLFLKETIADENTYVATVDFTSIWQ